VPAATKLSADAEVESSDTAAEVTAAKTPAQLATEGAKRTSVDKIAESEETTTSPTSASPTTAGESGEAASTEAQVLEIRRTSSITKFKSKLSEGTLATDSDTVPDKPAGKIAVKESEVSPTIPPVRRQHRGSDIGEASPEEIRELERRLSIQEVDEEDDEEDEQDRKAGKYASIAAGVSSTDKAEEAVTKGEDIKEEDPKDASKAGASVGD
jgi:hypothetical protein